MGARVLFVCTGNSARSQMAEGLLRLLGGSRFEVHSAGTRPSRVNPRAIEVMDELGIDISRQRSKSLDEYLEQPFDVVITVCGHAAESCPIFPGGGRRLHWDLPDPAAASGTDIEVLPVFRAVRNDLRQRIQEFIRQADVSEGRGDNDPIGV